MDESIVNAVLDDWRSAPIDSRLRAMLSYVEKLVNDPESLTPDDIDVLHAAGVSNTAIQEAAYVTLLFSTMDRLADAFDFHIPSPEQVARTGQFLNQHGYTVANQIK